MGSQHRFRSSQPNAVLVYNFMLEEARCWASSGTSPRHPAVLVFRGLSRVEFSKKRRGSKSPKYLPRWRSWLLITPTVSPESTWHSLALPAPSSALQLSHPTAPKHRAVTARQPSMPGAHIPHRCASLITSLWGSCRIRLRERNLFC